MNSGELQNVELIRFTEGHLSHTGLCIKMGTQYMLVEFNSQAGSSIKNVVPCSKGAMFSQIFYR
jgi:hypothetical protein